VVVRFEEVLIGVEKGPELLLLHLFVPNLLRGHLFRHIQRLIGGNFNVGLDACSFPVGLRDGFTAFANGTPEATTPFTRIQKY
jgi:hypothetical protein